MIGFLCPVLFPRKGHLCPGCSVGVRWGSVLCRAVRAPSPRRCGGARLPLRGVPVGRAGLWSGPPRAGRWPPPGVTFSPGSGGADFDPGPLLGRTPSGASRGAEGTVGFPGEGRGGEEGTGFPVGRVAKLSWLRGLSLPGLGGPVKSELGTRWGYGGDYRWGEPC